MVYNQHAILDGAQCFECVRLAVRPVEGVHAAPPRRAPGPRHGSATTGEASAGQRVLGEGGGGRGGDGGGGGGGVSKPASQTASLLFDLAALAPFSLSFGSEFNDMLALDGNVTNACQFPHKSGSQRAISPDNTYSNT